MPEVLCLPIRVLQDSESRRRIQNSWDANLKIYCSSPQNKQKLPLSGHILRWAWHVTACNAFYDDIVSFCCSIRGRFQNKRIYNFFQCGSYGNVCLLHQTFTLAHIWTPDLLWMSQSSAPLQARGRCGVKHHPWQGWSGKWRMSPVGGLITNISNIMSETFLRSSVWKRATTFRLRFHETYDLVYCLLFTT